MLTDESWGAKLSVAKENVEHHIEEEEGEMFKKLARFLMRRSWRNSECSSRCGRRSSRGSWMKSWRVSRRSLTLDNELSPARVSGAFCCLKPELPQSLWCNLPNGWISAGIEEQMRIQKILRPVLILVLLCIAGCVCGSTSGGSSFFSTN